MADLFILAIFGHLLGDYFFQNKTMALKKSDKGKIGIQWCTGHCLLYTVLVCLLTWQIFSPWFALSVFIPHWLIDRFSLANLWLKLIRGRTFESAYGGGLGYRDFDVAFTAIVYTIVDNSMHFFCLWISLRLLAV